MAFLCRNDLLIAVGALLLFVAAVVIAARLQLRSDFTELLPQNDPELTQLREIGDRVGAPSTLIVAVKSQDPQANERFAEALVKNLRRLVGSDLRAIDYQATTTQAFFKRNRALYAELVDLRRVDDDFKKLLTSRKNPAFIPFADGDLGETVDDPQADLEALRKRLEKQRAGAASFPHGYYESEDRSLLAIVTWTRSSGTGDLSGFEIRDHVQGIIDQTNPARFGPLTVHITGDVASAIEEHDALKSDIEAVSLVCTVLVLAVIALYFRSVVALSYIFFPTLLGVAAALAVTELSIGYLNTNTAFLGSIILGNGINFGIIFLARYREERLTNRDQTVETCIARAWARTANPTLAAAIAAGIAYGSLALTAFRGFQQFGMVGGVGMILCWAATYSYCPALIHFGERVLRRQPRGRPVSSGALTSLAAVLFRQRRALMAILIGTTVLAGWAIVPLLGNSFEYDFSRLRNQRSRKQGAGDLYVQVGRIFPQDLAPVGIALLTKVGDGPGFRDALLAKDCADGLTRAGAAAASDPGRLQAECARRVAAGEPTGGLLSSVSTIHDFLPKDQDQKLAILRSLRERRRDPAFDLLSNEEKKKVDDWMPAADLRPLGPADLPDEIARRFRELNGIQGRVALIYPVRVWANWDGHNLIRLSGVMKDVRLPDGAVINAAGQPSLFAAMLRSIAHDGPIATEAALAGVVLMVIVLFREIRPILLVLSSLLVGVLWMGGAGAALGLRLNFLNFVALPVTLGIGIDYAVNVFARLTREPPSAQPRALVETGSAVVLCSSTTIIGYSSLLIASNGALRSFGKLAALGEVACLLAALLIVPMVSRIKGRRPATRQTPDAADPSALPVKEGEEPGPGAGRSRLSGPPG